MKLFLENGHLTDEGLAALAAGTLDELPRLEASEHLSFCDDCLVRYTNLLSEEPLEQPSQNLTLPVMRRIRQRAFKVLVNRYTAAVAAVAIAGTLWYSGVFTMVGETLSSGTPEMQPAPTATTQKAPEMPKNAITAALSGWMRQAGSWLRPGTAQPESEPDDQKQEPAATPKPQDDSKQEPQLTPKPAYSPTPAFTAPPAEPTPEPAGPIRSFLDGLFHKNDPN